MGNTPSRSIICKIPYGKIVTYDDVAKQAAAKRGIKRMSQRAVGSAIGKNKILIIVPCHRVIRKDNTIGGFACGVDKKIKLLAIENADIKTC